MKFLSFLFHIQKRHGGIQYFIKKMTPFLSESEISFQPVEILRKRNFPLLFCGLTGGQFCNSFPDYVAPKQVFLAIKFIKSLAWHVSFVTERKTRGKFEILNFLNFLFP